MLGVRDQVVQGPQPNARIHQNPSACGQPGSFGVGIRNHPSLVRRKMMSYPRDRHLILVDCRYKNPAGPVPGTPAAEISGDPAGM